MKSDKVGRVRFRNSHIRSKSAGSLKMEEHNSDHRGEEDDRSHVAQQQHGAVKSDVLEYF